MLEVVIRTPDAPEKTIVSDKDSVMIGRASANDICLDVGGISRYHARLAVEGNQVSVQDLDSTNGVYLNSEKVRSAIVTPNDTIHIGSVSLKAQFKPDLPKGENGATSAPPPRPDPKREGERSRSTDMNIERPRVAAEPAAKPAPVVIMEPKAASAQQPAAKATSSHATAGQAAPAKSSESPVKVGSASEEFYWQSLASFLGPVWKYQIDDAVTEILINGPSEIYVETKGRLQSVPERFSVDALQAAVLNIAQYVGRRVSEDEPYLDARLPDGSRVAILMPPCSRKGTSISIRKFAKEKLTLDKLISFGSLTKEMVTFLNACVLLKKNIIVSGGTSSGKTSLLNVVSGLIPADERILTIEDSAELQLSQDHVLPMETKPADKKGKGQVTIRDLVRASLRMRPDRLIVGEIRSGEALDLLQAMNTGHSGSMATVHASSPPQALTRLETLALFSGIEIPMRALREQVSTAIDIVIQASRLPDHSRKVTHISEVGRLKDDGSYEVFDIFRFNNEGRTPEGKIKGSHLWTGHVPKSIHEMELSGLSDALALFQK